MLETFLTSFATLFVIIDPIGLAAISIGLLAGHPYQQKRWMIWRACIIAFVILLMFGLFGEGLLEKIGISMPAFRVSGGILLFLTALEMLFGGRVERRNNIGTEGEGGDDPSVYPLAMPLLAGPGAMTAMILLVGDNNANWQSETVVFATLALVLLITAILCLVFNRFSHHLGETGIQIINRFLAIILAALAVQFIVDGSFEFFREAFL